MKDIEVNLVGGRSTTSVVRIGNVVHRTKGKNYQFIHALLDHLEVNNFDYSPRLLGIDNQGREKLSFIEGTVPQGETLNEQQLISAIGILRQFHDICSKSVLCEDQETICHNDFAPWNIIFNHGAPVGIIDFDDAAPGSRMEDVAYFIWTFLDLGIAKISDEDQVNSIVMLCRAYQLADSRKIIDAILLQQYRILEFRNHIVLTEEDEEKRAFSQEAIFRIEASIQWVVLNQGILYDSLKN